MNRVAGSLAVLMGLALPGSALAQIVPCPTPAVSRPDPAVVAAPANAVGCERGVGLTVGTADLFRCQVMPAPGQDDIPEGSPEYVFLLDRPRHDRVVLPDSLMAGRFDAYEVLTVDLDVDGQPEHVLAAWNAQGNGIGVNQWTIRVFDADWNVIATFDDVADWGGPALSPRRMAGPAATWLSQDMSITSMRAAVRASPSRRDSIGFWDKG